MQIIYDGNKLITEYRSDNDRLDFLYDNNGLLYVFINNKTERYYYVRDVLQNILGIIDSNGNLLVKYNYNAYGELLSITGSNTTIGLRNPFRYKGYYYDSETEFFWCNSRYYNPEWGRLLTPDSIEYLDPESINGLNLYAYCGNDPVMYVDRSGNFAISITALLIGMAIGAGVGAGIGTGLSLYKDYQDDESINGSIGWQGYVGNIVGGAIAGAGTGFVGVLGAAIGTASVVETAATLGKITLTVGNVIAIGA